MNAPELYIATVEDQLELDLPGVTQVQVHESIGDTASILRTVLAQDPDIVMAGNLARPEAAAVVLEAARRHLMIGGLTAKDAAAAMSYLINPPRGPEDSHGSYRTTPHPLARSLRLVVNQRLVRRICEDCKQEIEMDPEHLLRYGLTEDETRQVKTRFGEGCAACNKTGYRGRIGLFEVLKIDTEIKELLIAGASEEMLRQKTSAKAAWTLRQSAMQKLRDGVTTIEEIAREIQL